MLCVCVCVDVCERESETNDNLQMGWVVVEWVVVVLLVYRLREVLLDHSWHLPDDVHAIRTAIDVLH